MKTTLRRTVIIALFFLLLGCFFGCNDTKETSTSLTSVSSTSFTDISTMTTSDQIPTSIPITTISSNAFTTTPSTHLSTQITTTVITSQTNPATSETVTYVSSLSVTPPDKSVYLVGDSLDLSGMVVRYTDAYGQETLIDHVDCQIEQDSFDTYGEKTVNVSYNEITVSFPVTCQLPTYYLSAQDKSGETLKSSLNTILNTGLRRKSYGEARYILDDTDRDPSNASNVIMVYLGTSVSGVWDGTTWNREHVWPTSLMGLSGTPSNSAVNVGSDLHNLKPANASENSRRSNKYFANEPWPYVTGYPSYCPRDEVKGDIARILFYMVVMYEDAPLDLELVNHAPANYQMAMLDILLSWHEQDPVDQFERNRNEMIYAHQKNRNPFIDYPPFVDLIWGD